MIKKYQKYKESGIECIGLIPQDWIVSKIRYFVSAVKTGKTPPTENELYFQNGDINWFGPGDFKSLNLDESNRKITSKAVEELGLELYPKNSILLIGIGATLGKVGVIKSPGFSNQQVNAIIFNSFVEPKYGLYFLDVFKEITINEANASTLAILNQSKTKDLKLLIPSILEQITIVCYLDHQTAIIDQLIQQKEKLIQLLKEKRQAVINEAVTKGLNPNAKMKDSGIEWLGDVPEHWEVTKMKYMATITRGAILRPVDDPEYFDDNGEWTYLNISDATKCDKYLHEGKLRLSELGSTKSARVLPDNLILTASATIGKPFINKIPVCVHDGFIPITNIKCSIDYLYHYLRNPQLYVALGKVNTQKNIYLDEVKDMFVTQPPLNEQIDIVGFLEKFEETNNELILQVENQIDKLNEYRQSIISEAVTGKIDVRDWQPNIQTTA